MVTSYVIVFHFRTKLEQKGEIDIYGLGPFGRIIEIFARSFLHAGVKRVRHFIDIKNN
jgi:hypothetical protein